MAERLSTTPRLSLTPGHWARVEASLSALQREESWHGELPVLLLERCWLRLSSVPLRDLLLRLPPDGSREAPELVRYRDHLARGWPPWLALEHCWVEFGAAACREALLRFWEAQDRASGRWTLPDYLVLMEDYRRRFLHERPRPLPLILLPRRPLQTVHDGQRLVWLSPAQIPLDGSMRHTCA
jgi:hypothetical protein